MFNKIKAVFKKDQPPTPQLSEEDRKKELDNQLLNLTALPLNYPVTIPTIIAEVQSLLEKGANINARGNKQTTVLHDAVKDDRLELVKFFISQGSEVNAKNRYGQTPLYQVKSAAVTQELLAAGADINVTDNDNCTPLKGFLHYQNRLSLANKHLRKVEGYHPKMFHEANESLAKAYLRKNPDLERPNFPEEIISKNDWEVWKEQILKECDALAAPLASLPSASKATPTEGSIKEAVDSLEKGIQGLQVQQEGDKKMKDNRLVASYFFTKHETTEENQQTKLEEKLKLSSG